MGAVYLIDGKPHRLCDCDQMSPTCPRGVKRSHQTCGYGQCFVPAPDVLMALGTASETASDTARLDFLAEITNLSALRDFGAMLTGEQGRKIDKTAEILSGRYEVHRRTHDTSVAFRAAVDEAMKETGRG